MVFTAERIGRLVKDLERMVYPLSVDVGRFKMKKTQERYREPDGLDTSGWEDFTASDRWGGHNEHYWFDTAVEIPPEMDGACVAFEITTGREKEWDATNPQFTLYLDGKLLQGLDVNHRSVVLSESAVAGNVYRLTLSAFSGTRNYHLQLQAQLRVLDRLTEKYYYDVAVPYRAALLMDRQDAACITILQALQESLNLLDLRQEFSPAYYESLAQAQENLTNGFYARSCKIASPVVRCVGHTHIDVAWLWTLAVTREKSVRSFSTVLALMDEFPEYIFMSSQPQLYKYFQEYAPEVFEKIRERVREGRWEAEGAMFVEADCNIASGEALVRQILAGKRYFRKEFGVDNKILWLPDVFGYSAALPQIMQRSGIEYFMTTKINWNEVNQMPCDTFDWVGIDGTRILTHFIPTRDYNAPAQPGTTRTGFFTTYNGNLNPSQVMGGWQRYQQKHLNREVLMSFGYGDGGGGPTREMLENQRRLSLGIPGCPRTVMSTAREFFRQLEQDVKGKKDLPVWSGELYLEYHRGTYTSMARNKKYNRRSEFAWQNAEWLCAMDALMNGAAYPAGDIAAGWEVVLRNQFHDILPGSSIKEVYDDSMVEYEQTLASSRDIIGRALQSLADGVAGGTGQPCLVVFNPNGFAVAGPLVYEAQGDLVYPGSQRLEDGRWLAMSPEVPSRGYLRLGVEADNGLAAPAVQEGGLLISPERLSNDCLDIRLDGQGRFVSIYDKRACRELLPARARANVLMSYEDKPHNYDAWDVNSYYREKSWEVDDVESILVTEAGPVRGCLQIRRRYLDSTVVQSIYLWLGQARVDIRSEVVWHEKQVLLKALFPVDIHSAQATFDIQYGNVQRATHTNTSWDAARFEVCMHKWMDVSEADYGVSFLNDSKYGCSVLDGVIGLSLLKSAIYPNPDADKERHEFTYSLYLHTGDWRQAGTVREAYLQNNPLMTVVSGLGLNPAALSQTKPESILTLPSLPEAFSLVRADQDNIVIEAVKRAGDSEDWIVRFYECHNRRATVRLTFGLPVLRAAECDLMEQELAVLDIVAAGEQAGGRVIELAVKPYEIRTVKVRFDRKDTKTW